MTKNFFKIISILIIITLCFSTFSKAQDTRNVLPLHTGKSYILDFPIKITRVVGGDPTAMELNLFKKDVVNGEVPGYQLLIAPMAEKTTNIIVWTDIGLYVFDVVIDNASPYTAETIVNVPKEKKFIIPLVASTQSKTNNAYPKLSEDNKINLSENTGEVIDKTNSNPPADNSEEIKVEPKVDNNEVSGHGNEKNEALPVTNDNNEKTIPPDDKNEGSFTLDLPPDPDAMDKNNKKAKKPDKSKPKAKTNIKTTTKPENIELKPLLETDKQVNLAQETKTDDEIEIVLKPQTSSNLNIKPSLDSKTVNLYSGKLTSSNNGLKLEVNSVNRVDNGFVIHLEISNSSNECKYLLWDLTKVTDETGRNFYVRNQNLPPGIVYPQDLIKGDLIAYPKTDKASAMMQDKLTIKLMGTQGQPLVSIDVPIKKENK